MALHQKIAPAFTTTELSSNQNKPQHSTCPSFAKFRCAHNPDAHQSTYLPHWPRLVSSSAWPSLPGPSGSKTGSWPGARRSRRFCCAAICPSGAHPALPLPRPPAVDCAGRGLAAAGAPPRVRRPKTGGGVGNRTCRGPGGCACTGCRRGRCRPAPGHRAHPSSPAGYLQQ